MAWGHQQGSGRPARWTAALTQTYCPAVCAWLSVHDPSCCVQGKGTMASNPEFTMNDVTLNVSDLGPVQTESLRLEEVSTMARSMPTMVGDSADPLTAQSHRPQFPPKAPVVSAPVSNSYIPASKDSLVPYSSGHIITSADMAVRASNPDSAPPSCSPAPLRRPGPCGRPLPCSLPCSFQLNSPSWTGRPSLCMTRGERAAAWRSTQGLLSDISCSCAATWTRLHAVTGGGVAPSQCVCRSASQPVR